MALTDRKAAELLAKLTSLEHEFKRWHDLSEAGARLEKHNTQIRRVVASLHAAVDEVQVALNDDVTSDRVLANWMDREEMILDIHQIWDFFRAKLALRCVDGFTDALVVADEFAWACYRPAQARASSVEASAIREPPLVFFSETPTPFALPRGQSYERELGSTRLSREEFRQIVKRLPIPVIGIPWFQTEHLPDALLIAHEVGHHVEDDLQLTNTLVDLVEAALVAVNVPPARRAAWQAWCGEVFADTYATLAVGPAFVGALADFLSVDAERMRAESQSTPTWGSYPTRYLRVRYACAVLDALGMKTEADDLRNKWQTSYPEHAMHAFDTDLAHVAVALVDGHYPGLGCAQLNTVIEFASLHAAATQDSARLLKSYPAENSSARILLAAAALAFATNPTDYAKNGVRKRVVERIVAAQSPGTRFRGGAEQPPDAKAQADHDRAVGQSIFAQLAPRDRSAPAPGG